MNILVIGHYGLYRHLSASFVHQQAKTYGELGHNVRVLIPIPLGKAFNKKKFGPGFFQTEADGIQLNYLRYASFSNIGKRHINNKSAILALRPHLKKLFSDFTPDVIHAHTLGLDSGIGAWLKKRFGCPLVVTTHGSDAVNPLEKGDGAWLREMADMADCIISVSRQLTSRLCSCGTKTPVETVLNGFVPREMPVGLKKDPYAMIQVGNLVPSKRNGVTLRAFAGLKKSFPEMTLKIVGSGVLRGELEELCRELGVEDSVTFTGQLPNHKVFEEMCASTYFVMASKPEGFGIVYLEAMAAGCVAVGTEGQGIADLIRSGENGYLVPADDVDAIVKVISECISDQNNTLSVAKSGRADALELTWEKNARECLGLMNTLISNRCK